MKIKALLSLSLLSTVISCAEGDDKTLFKADVKNQDIQIKAAEAEPSSDQIPAATAPAPAVEALAAPEPAPAEAIQSLSVILSEKLVRSGALNIQAKAKLGQPSSSKIVWSIEGPKDIDIGKIDTNGKYTSPAKVAATFEVSIVAALADDPSIVGSAPLTVAPANQVFLGCKKGNVTLPIVGDIYRLASGADKLPNFSAIKPVDTTCMDKIAQPNVGWAEGFPGAPDLKENFAIRMKAKLIAPVTGIYEFRSDSDDGSKLTLNGKVVINHDGLHSYLPSEVGKAELAIGGDHTLVFDFFQGPRTHFGFTLLWKVPGTKNFVVVPASAYAAYSAK